jgi:hypothetical protein
VADAPWRCSQCGTINEPVANACRTCGRWPSLFDLEESKIEDVPAALDVEDEGDFVDLESPAPEPEPAFEPEPEQPLPTDAEPEPPVDQEVRSRRRRRQQLVRFAIPVGIALYILISSIANR